MYTRVFVKVTFMGTLLVCLTGCAGQQEPVPHIVTTVGSSQAEEYPKVTQEELARLHDLSFPLHAEPYKLLSVDNQMIFAYATDHSHDELVAFYHAQMDYCGWEEISLLRGPESCLVFSKPSKLCTITLRSEGAKIRVTIFIAGK